MEFDNAVDGRLPRPRPRRVSIGRVLLAIAVSVACGGAIGAISLQSGFQQLPQSIHYWRPRTYNLQHLQKLREEIAEYRKQNGKLPETLEGLPSAARFGATLDFWEHPYHYQVDGDNYKLLATGRDSKIGGEGLDADLDGTEVEASLPKTLSWTQFVQEPHGRNMIGASIAVGLITACVMCPWIFTTTRERSIVIAIVGLAGTAFVAWVVGGILVMVHIPSGH